MFTGIIETIGSVTSIETSGTNKSFWISSHLSHELKVDQSVSHNGVCLTVEEIKNNQHKVTAILETLQKTNVGSWKLGDNVNIERCLPMNGRLDGHIVQGHVDTTAQCVNVSNENGSWVYTFEFPKQFAHLVIEKGSICINGISLTAFNIGLNTLTVAIIPYTYEHTNIKQVTLGDSVNFEFDILGKYMARWRSLSEASV